MKSDDTKNKSLPARSGFIRFFVRHQSLVLGLAVTLVVFIFLTSRQATASNFLYSWNFGALCYLVLTWVRMIRSDVRRIRQRSKDLDFSDSLLLVLSCAAALASIGCIGIELHNVKSAGAEEALAHAGVAILTILISWVFLHTLFTVHYAHHFYSGRAGAGGLKFPMDDPDVACEPVYWDFLYFAFTIGVAAQTADVSVTSMPMRRFALLHSVLSFLFNTTIVALAINVGASLI